MLAARFNNLLALLINLSCPDSLGQNRIMNKPFIKIWIRLLIGGLPERRKYVKLCQVDVPKRIPRKRYTHIR